MFVDVNSSPAPLSAGRKYGYIVVPGRNDWSVQEALKKYDNVLKVSAVIRDVEVNGLWFEVLVIAPMPIERVLNVTDISELREIVHTEGGVLIWVNAPRDIIYSFKRFPLAADTIIELLRHVDAVEVPVWAPIGVRRFLESLGKPVVPTTGGLGIGHANIVVPSVEITDFLNILQNGDFIPNIVHDISLLPTAIDMWPENKRPHGEIDGFVRTLYVFNDEQSLRESLLNDLTSLRYLVRPKFWKALKLIKENNLYEALVILRRKTPNDPLFHKVALLYLLNRITGHMAII